MAECVMNARGSGHSMLGEMIVPGAERKRLLSGMTPSIIPGVTAKKDVPVTQV